MNIQPSCTNPHSACHESACGTSAVAPAESGTPRAFTACATPPPTYSAEQPSTTSTNVHPKPPGSEQAGATQGSASRQHLAPGGQLSPYASPEVPTFRAVQLSSSLTFEKSICGAETATVFVRHGADTRTLRAERTTKGFWCWRTLSTSALLGHHSYTVPRASVL